MADPFELTCDALGSDVVLAAFRGREAVSQPGSLEVFVTVPLDAVPEADAVVNTPLVLSIAGGVGADEPAHRHGLVAAMEVIDETAERALIRLEQRPALWWLGLSRHARVFTEKSVPEIIEEVFGEAELSEYELRLSGSYPALPHVGQYRESDLDFVQRLMDHEGIFYFHEHTDGGHTLVLADDSSYPSSRGEPIRYQPSQGGDLGSDLFEAFTERRRLLPKSVLLTDHDYERPALAIEGEAEVSEETSAAIVVHGGAPPPKDAARLATLRQEALAARAHTFSGRGPAYHLRSGHTFELTAHPRGALNETYLCTELSHQGNLRARTPELARLVGVPAEVVYEAETRAILASVQYRPERTSPRPRPSGLTRGNVDGPADSDYAQLDEQGRYHVKLGFDETDRAGDKASVRTRMMQPHAGNPEGWHLPLRKETEVLVAFIGGDPDRPVIAGAVPNAETPSVVTSQNHTRNIFHSGGDNHVEIEDLDGEQWVDVRSPTEDSRLHLGKPHDDDSHHVVEHTDANCRFTIGKNQDIRVGAKLTEEVTGDVTETYNTSQTSKVASTQDTTVMGAVEETYETGHETTVTSAVSETYIAGQQTTVDGMRFELYDTTQSTTVVGGATHHYDTQDTTVNGPSTQTYLGPKVVTVSGACEYTFDASVTQLFGPTIVICPSATWTIQGSGTFFTPSWTHLHVSDRSTCGNVSHVMGVEIEAFGIALGLISPLKFELVAIALAVTGLKLEDNIIAVGPFGALLILTGGLFTTEALELDAAPFIKEGC